MSKPSEATVENVTGVLADAGIPISVQTGRERTDGVYVGNIMAGGAARVGVYAHPGDHDSYLTMASYALITAGYEREAVGPSPYWSLVVWASNPEESK